MKTTNVAKQKLTREYQNGNNKHAEIPDILALKKIQMGSNIS